MDNENIIKKSHFSQQNISAPILIILISLVYSLLLISDIDVRMATTMVMTVF